MNLNEHNYYEDTSHVTNSMLGLLKKHPYYLYNHIKGDRRDPTDPMRFGSLYHCLVLEPHLFKQTYAVIPKGTKRGNYAPFKKFVEENPGKEYITQGEYDKAMPMRDALMTNNDAAKLIQHPQNEFEKILAWEREGVMCKCKMDINNPNFNADLKSALDCYPDAFKHKAVNYYDYDRQAVMYTDGDGGEKPFYFIVQEKEPPFVSSVLEVASSEFIQSGQDKYAVGLAEYRAYFVEKTKDPSRGIVDIL